VRNGVVQGKYTEEYTLLKEELALTLNSKQDEAVSVSEQKETRLSTTSAEQKQYLVQ
jgi:hypothetical protein